MIIETTPDYERYLQRERAAMALIARADAAAVFDTDRLIDNSHARPVICPLHGWWGTLLGDPFAQCQQDHLWRQDTFSCCHQWAAFWWWERSDEEKVTESAHCRQCANRRVLKGLGS